MTALPPTSPPPPVAAAAPPSMAQAVGLVARRLRARVGRSLFFVTCLCLGIALLFTAWFGGGLYRQFVFSMSIGVACWLITDGARLAMGAATAVARQRLGLPWDPQAGWLRWRGMIPLILLGSVLGPPLGIAVADRILDQQSPPLWSLDSPTSRITLTVSLLATLIATLAFSWQERLAAVKSEAQAARRAQAESQLRLLQSQLEPHMLFNTLANLRVLIGLDPVRAQAMLDRLIAYLRATLQASRLPLHPLSVEFDRVADYLALLEVRMGPRLQVRLELPAALRERTVPPLILQPLVENCIRHGLEPQVAGGRLTVTASEHEGLLELQVSDNGAGLASPAASGSTGFGLEQVRSRLATLYGDRASFELGPGPDGQGTRARIRLPAEPPLAGPDEQPMS